MKSVNAQLSDHELRHRHEVVPADYYDQGVETNVLQRLWHRQRQEIIGRFLHGRGGRLLDLGCHGGFLTSIIAAESGAEVTGLDISAEAIRYAARRMPAARFLVQDLQAPWPLPDASFETVTAFDVLEHIPQLDHVFREIARVLTPGGMLIIGVPRETVIFRLVWIWWIKSRGAVWDDVHVHAFDGRDLMAAALKVGLRFESKTVTHWGMYQVLKFVKR